MYLTHVVSYRKMSNIGAVLYGRTKTAGGFIWKYSQNISECS